MAKRKLSLKKPVKSLNAADPARQLGKALAKRAKGELVDVLVQIAREDGAVFRRLAALFDLEAPPNALVEMTRRAIDDATTFEAREVNYNFDYDGEAYEHVQHNLQRLIQLKQLRPAMELSLELMAQGSRQVEMSHEGWMSDDIESCLKPVLKALQKCDLPAAEVTAWCAEMIRRDRVGFICDQELVALRRRFKARR